MSNEIIEEWVPVVIKHFGPEFEKGVFENYEVSRKCMVRNKKTKLVMSYDKRNCVHLSGATIRKMLLRHRICLGSFFPNEIPINIDEYHCDHIDGNHDNMVLSNLQWLTRGEHSIKTMVQTKDTRKSLVDKQGKIVKIVSVTGTGKVELLNTIYDSVTMASKELGLDSGNISRSARKGYLVNNQYKFEYVTYDLLEGEEFKKIGKYKVSNRGRVKMKSGLITVGADIPNTIYRNIGIKLKGDIKKRPYLVHVLILMAFVGNAPKGHVGMHNDTYNTLDDTGYQRNWVEDLKWGTQSENMQSYNDNRTDLKRVRCVDTNIEYHSIGEASRLLGLNDSNIRAVCQKKRKMCGSKRFEYC